MTPRPPARILGYFAKDAPICIIFRRGPSRYTQMIRWRTDTDEFEPGQWIRGNVQGISMTRDGQYAALRIMGTRSRIDSWEDTQQAIVCKPPFFTALEAYIGGLCFTSAYFTEDNRLCTRGDKRVVNALNQCPFERSDELRAGPEYGPRLGVVDATSGPATGRDQAGRTILLQDGRVFVVEAGKQRLLFDCNLYSFEAIAAPEWAMRW